MDEKKSAESGALQFKGIWAELYEWLEAIAFALAIVVLLFTFVFRIVRVDGDSMTPTLQNENRVLVNRLMREPEENDIVIVVMPEDAAYNKTLIKRVVAVGGEYIQILDGTVYVGETPENMTPRRIVGLPEITVLGNAHDWSSPVLVPEDCVFVMGDNRNDSLDSRDTRVGFIPKERLLGNVILRMYPVSEFGTVKTVTE